jgi:hypothetical protein
MSEAKSGTPVQQLRLIMKCHGLSPDVASAHPGYYSSEYSSEAAAVQLPLNQL